ncbi:MAG: VTT domain-containing protein [Actinomycetota bacterium]|nr:VTT domain-containing protein [Actinomycetota bacterium]
MGDVALLGVLGAAFAFGVGSALLPVFLNAEAYVVAMGALVNTRVDLVFAILALSVGTLVGKVFVFELARTGSSKIRSVDRKPSRNAFFAKVRRFSDWLLSLLDRRYEGALTVLMSSLFGIPPLAVVTVMAGASRQPRWLFLLMVFIGRTAQFLVIAFLVHKAT